MREDNGTDSDNVGADIDATSYPTLVEKVSDGLIPPLSVIGEVVHLMVASPNHRHFFLADLEWLLIPPITLKQCILLRQGGKPFAFASWAFLDDEAEERMRAGLGRPRPSDWHSGKAAWIIDVVVPIGDTDLILRQVKEQVFPTQTFKVLRRMPEEGVFSVAEW